MARCAAGCAGVGGIGGGGKGVANNMTHTSNIFSVFDLSNASDGGRLLQRYETWFERYPQCAQKSLRQRLAKERNAKGAWFELLLHELFLQFGCEVTVKDVNNENRSPDFLVDGFGRGCYVEATTVNPKDNPGPDDRNLQDAVRLLNTLESSDFQIDLSVEGKILNPVSKKELSKKFGALLSEHDPVMVREQIALMGGDGAPYAEIKHNGWVLRGTLRLIPPEGKHRTSLDLIADVGGSYTGDASPQVQKRVSNKARKYGDLDAPLIVAANVLDARFDREAEVAVLFGQEQFRYTPDRPEIPDQLIRKPDGVWIKGGYKPRYTRLAGVILFNGLHPRDPRGSVCLYINPFRSSINLPEPLYKLPHAIGEDGRLNWVEGIDIETLLAI